MMENINITEEEAIEDSNANESKHDSANKPSSKKKKTGSSHKYASLSPGVIKVIAETIGISDLPEDVQKGLAENASLKLREFISDCGVLLKNTNRKRLLTEDVNRVLETADAPPIYGHSSPDECGYTFIPEAGVFIENDDDVDLVAAACIQPCFSQKKKQCVNVYRVVLDPRDFRAKDKNEAGTSGESSSSAAQETAVANKPPPELLDYYIQVAKVILGGSTPLLVVALTDVKSNPRIGPLCPYFLNLIALSVNKMMRHAWLTDALLSTAQAIMENQFVDPSCYLAVNRAVNSLLVLAIEPKVAKNCDDLLLRTRAAQLLAKAFVCWNIEMKQQVDIIRQLLQLLLDKNISLQTHYGAIVSLISLGYRVLYQFFWPVMGRYIPILEEKQKTCSPVAVAHVKDSILMAAEKMYRKEWSPNTSMEESKRMLKVDQMLYDYFGDALLPRRHEFLKRSPKPLYPKVSNSTFTDSETAEDVPTPMDCDLKNQNGSFVIQRSYLSYKVPYVFKKKATEHRSNFFKTTQQSAKLKGIIFNFNDSNRRAYGNRKLDSSNQIYYDKTSHRFPTIWYSQNVYKNTRTIKYFKKSHTRSPSGDLFTLLL